MALPDIKNYTLQQSSLGDYLRANAPQLPNQVPSGAEGWQPQTYADLYREQTGASAAPSGSGYLSWLQSNYPSLVTDVSSLPTFGSLDKSADPGSWGWFYNPDTQQMARYSYSGPQAFGSGFLDPIIAMAAAVGAGGLMGGAFGGASMGGALGGAGSELADLTSLEGSIAAGQGGLDTAIATSGLSGVDAINAAAPGSISMGLTDPQIAADPFLHSMFPTLGAPGAEGITGGLGSPEETNLIPQTGLTDALTTSGLAGADVLSPELTNLVPQTGLTDAISPLVGNVPAQPFAYPGQGSFPIQFTPADASQFGTLSDTIDFETASAAGQAGGQSILDQLPNLPPGLQKFLKDNWKTIAGGATMAATAMKPQPKIPNIGDLTGIAESLKGAGAGNVAGAQQLMQSLQSGTLPAAQQATLDAAKETAKSNIRGKYASLGLSGSTMEQQELNNVDLQGTALAGQMEKQLFDAGLAELGVAGSEQVNAANLYKELSSLSLSEDQQLRDALSRFAGSLAMGGAIGAVGR